ncbi:hypothetical protein NDU88_003967 [Pleurodeles waltl]|uniref:Uncharacterized protein n=1 Tax=Pleurodeles waltl TaxID=8319 RepID=A0AAV7W904_PLEWA|nr:hypothetical protein NDU88_003967 [Pleurodeles waltl]
MSWSVVSLPRHPFFSFAASAFYSAFSSIRFSEELPVNANLLLFSLVKMYLSVVVCHPAGDCPLRLRFEGILRGALCGRAITVGHPWRRSVVVSRTAAVDRVRLQSDPSYGGEMWEYNLWAIVGPGRAPGGRPQAKPGPQRSPRTSSHLVPAGTSLAAQRRAQAGTHTFTSGDSSWRGCGRLERPADTALSTRPGATMPSAPIPSSGMSSDPLRCESSVGKPRLHFAPTLPRSLQRARTRVPTGPGGPAPLSSGGAAACQRALLGSPPLRLMDLSSRRLYLRFAPGLSSGFLCCEGSTGSARPLHVVPAPRLCHITHALSAAGGRGSRAVFGGPGCGPVCG